MNEEAAVYLVIFVPIIAVAIWGVWMRWKHNV